MRYLYSLLFYLALPGIFFRLWWKGRKTSGYRQRWNERLGFIKMQPDQTIWLHAVSLGELIAARPLIAELLKKFPSTKILITNMTVSGSGLAAKLAGDNIDYAFLPYDIPGAVKRFLDRAQPRLAIIMETELWPNLITCTAQRGIPILLANARLSERSSRGYQKIKCLTKPLLQNISLIAAQTLEDAQRFLSIGASKDRTRVLGNIKFDVPYPTELVKQGRALRTSWGESRSTVIAASTHAGEEDKILIAFKQLRTKHPQALLILVPRHPERFDEVANLCQKMGFSYARRSQGRPCTSDTAVFLGDSLGELFLYYAVSDIAFVGGSFNPIGGHNLLEPAALALPILTGPHLFNFTEVAYLLTTEDALITVKDEEELSRAWDQLLNNESSRNLMGKRAQQVVENNKGALEKHLDFISQNM